MIKITGFKIDNNFTQIGSTVQDEAKQTEKQFVACEQHEEWANLGFVRAITVSTKICEALSTNSWINMCLELIENSEETGLDLPKQVSTDLKSNHNECPNKIHDSYSSDIRY